MRFMDAFDNAQPAPENEPLPRGVYDVRVVTGEYHNTKKGDDSYRMNFEVSDGSFKGRRISRIWVLTDKAAGYAKRDLEKFGITTGKQLIEPFPGAGIEVYCQLLVLLKTNDDGTEFNDIKKIDNIRIERVTGNQSGISFDPKDWT